MESAQWKLAISYFKMEQEALTVSIKVVNNPFEVKKSKDYFKKREFFLPSNVANGMQVNPFEEADEDMPEEELLKHRKQMEQAQ